MKPPVVHHPVEPPPNPADANDDVVAEAEQAPPAAAPQGLVGSYGPLVSGPKGDDKDGAGADERKAP